MRFAVPPAKTQPESQPNSQLGDFNAGPRMIMLSGLGLILGAAGAALAWILLHLIYACTNLFYYQRLSWTFVSPAQNQLHWLALFVPVAGGIIVGLMARYGSDKIRGHGIPEALESILIHGARISPRVALFKPLGSAVAIGTGGPFGAEGPIIMTAGSVGSTAGPVFSSHRCGAVDPAGGRSRGGHGGSLFHAAGSHLARGGIAALRVAPALLCSGRRSGRNRRRVAAILSERRSAISHAGHDRRNASRSPRRCAAAGNRRRSAGHGSKPRRICQ